MSAAPPLQDFYADPLVYDVLHRAGTRGEVRTLLRLAARHLPSASLNRPLEVLEPACGSGRYLFELAALGHRTAGFDLSAPMIRYAKARARSLGLHPSPRLFVADMTNFPVRPSSVDLAFNPINTIRHLASDRAMLAHLARVRRALRPGGAYIVGLEVANPAWSQPSEDVWTGRGEGLRVHQVVSYVPPREPRRGETVLSHLTVYAGRGGGRRERHVDSRYVLRTYTRAQWDRLLRRAEFQIAGIYGPTGRAKRSEEAIHGYFLWVLRPSPGR